MLGLERGELSQEEVLSVLARAKARGKKRRKKADDTPPDSSDEDVAARDALATARERNDTPILWVRFDFEKRLLRPPLITQPCYGWVEQLFGDDDAAAQLQAGLLQLDVLSKSLRQGRLEREFYGQGRVNEEQQHS